MEISDFLKILMTFKRVPQKLIHYEGSSVVVVVRFLASRVFREYIKRTLNSLCSWDLAVIKNRTESWEEF